MQTRIGAGMAALLVLGCVGIGEAAGGPAVQETAASSALAPFAEHLRFLGYEVTAQDKLLKVIHDRRLNFTLRGVEGGAMLLAYFEGKQPEIDRPRLEFVERLNQAATCARYYWDDESDLMVEAWFPGEHERARFALFMEAWQGDADRVFAAEELTALVK